MTSRIRLSPDGRLRALMRTACVVLTVLANFTHGFEITVTNLYYYNSYSGVVVPTYKSKAYIDNEVLSIETTIPGMAQNLVFESSEGVFKWTSYFARSNDTGRVTIDREWPCSMGVFKTTGPDAYLNSTAAIETRDIGGYWQFSTSDIFPAQQDGYEYWYDQYCGFVYKYKGFNEVLPNGLWLADEYYIPNGSYFSLNVGPGITTIPVGPAIIKRDFCGWICNSSVTEITLTFGTPYYIVSGCFRFPGNQVHCKFPNFSPASGLEYALSQYPTASIVRQNYGYSYIDFGTGINIRSLTAANNYFNPKKDAVAAYASSNRVDTKARFRIPGFFAKVAKDRGL